MFGCNNDHLFPKKCAVKFSCWPKVHVNTELVPPGHPILLFTSNKFNMANISVKGLLQSVSIFFKFVNPCLFYLLCYLYLYVPSFDVLQLSGYFYVWLNLVAVLTVKILIKVVTLLYWCCCGKNVLLTLSSQFHNNYDHFLFYRLLIQYLRWQLQFHFLYQMENLFLHSHFPPPPRLGKQIHHQLKRWVIFL